MTQSMWEQASAVWDQASDQFEDTTHKASRAATGVSDAFEDGVASARRAVRQGGDAVTELMNDTKKRVQQHPIEAVAATFAAGIGAGAVIGWMMRHKRRCSCTDAPEKVQE